jgi:hypothetical protein
MADDDLTDSENELMDEYMDSIVEIIQEHGWAVQWVGGDQENVPFAYTVGLFIKALPEFVVFGLPPHISQPILNDLAARAVKGERVTDGQVLHDVLRGFPAAVVEVIDTTGHLSVANALARSLGIESQVRAWQVVYPDAANRWPWEPGSNVVLSPLLGAVPTLSE